MEAVGDDLLAGGDLISHRSYAEPAAVDGELQGLDLDIGGLVQALDDLATIGLAPLGGLGKLRVQQRDGLRVLGSKSRLAI
jgi:hypothetical protein